MDSGALQGADAATGRGEHTHNTQNVASAFQKGPRVLRTAHPHDIEDCENLLENYFMQVRWHRLPGTM